MGMSFRIDTREAEEIALRFLAQHHSVRGVQSIVFEEGAWTVAVLVSSPRLKKIVVNIDAKTGHILGWH